MRFLLALACAISFAQQNAPHAGYVFPAGGQRGQTIEVTAGGQFLNGVHAVLFSGPGVKAEVIEHIRPMTPMQATELRDKAQEINKKPPAERTPEDRKTLLEIRDKLQDFQRRRTNPMLSELVRLRATVDANAAEGLHEMRLLAAGGMTNPLFFAVGHAPEARKGALEELALPVVVNGQLAGGVVDRYRFHAAAGARLHASVEARALLPYIPDAVPGWVQAVITVGNPQAKEIASADHHFQQQDAELDFVAPAEGVYTLEVRDALFRGRDDFVYRVTLAEAASARAAPKLKSPSKLKLPAVVSDRIGKPGETRVYHLDAKADEEIVAEVIARREGSPLDSILWLTDAKGKELAANDDFADPGAGLVTHPADSRIQFKFAAKGTYLLHVADIQNHGGEEYVYKLRVDRPHPDFELRVAPATLNLRANSAAALTVYALRRDSFNGEIKLGLVNPPRGFALQGALIPAGRDKVRLTLTVPPPRTESPLTIELEGVSGTLRRKALPVEEMTQAFAWQHLVPVEKWLVQVLPAGRATAQWRTRADVPLRLAPNSTVTVNVAVPPRVAPDVKLALVDPPEGLSIESATPNDNGLSVTLKTGALKPAQQGNLLFEARVQRQLAGVLPAVPYLTAPESMRQSAR